MAKTGNAVKKSNKKTDSSRNQRVTGTSDSLNLQEAISMAVEKLPAPGEHSDVVMCKVETIEIMRGGFTDGRTLTVTMVIQ